jgi:catechol 2,3-dioxygenase-like lactoylglutathione lyase family enzyme
MDAATGIELGFVTLGVADVERHAEFFQAVLDLAPRRSGHGLVQFELARGVLGLMSGAALAELTGSAAIAGAAGGHLVSLHLASDERVRQALARVEPAGGRVVHGPLRLPWGAFAGFFEGPEGHAFELVAHAPKNRAAGA